MTLELRRISYRTGAAGRIAAAYEEALPARVELSPLAGFFTVDVGPLNSALELFWYPDAATREGVAASVGQLANWPIQHPDVTSMGEPLVLEDAPFNGPLEPGSYGGLFELRQYELQGGSAGEVMGAWGERIEWRRSLSPVLGAWYLPGEPTDTYVHLWAYRDAAERQQVRAAAAASGNWPPKTAVSPLTQANLLALPASFSPIH